MLDSAKIKKVLAYLREEIPAEDISENPVVRHPHNTARFIPERLPPAKIKELSQLQPARAVVATGSQWAAIAAAIALCTTFWHPVLYVLAVLVIGSSQHALLILGHDASHFRTLPVRWQNDLFANLFMMWPTFASVEGFRKFHGTHHKYTNLSNDGNRHIWYTHDAAGEPALDWQFPKTRIGLAWILFRRVAFLTGLFWVVRGLVGSTLIPSPGWMRAARFGFYASNAAALTYLGAWPAFLLYWIVPFCTWHIAAQYIRLICEHSAVESDEEEYSITRTTIPTWLESIFILPCNVGYHLEHQWYPSVPFYRLPQLHQALMERRLPRARRGKALGFRFVRRMRQRNRCVEGGGKPVCRLNASKNRRCRFALKPLLMSSAKSRVPFCSSRCCYLSEREPTGSSATLVPL